HHNNNQSWIAPEQLFKLTRSQEALQISVSATSTSRNRPYPKSGTPAGEPFSGCLSGDWPQSFRISGGDSENNTPPSPPPQIHHQP
ncbi:hypothetical protein, partial [Pseudarthrobacter sp. B4EP4b]|uniref:hypothetical protein n=1 Tax=Pseudarthrobacter sp. B4EP4b TaxID=2590664 RepID=UPI001C667933